ncbi:hypothetical protein JCM11641_005023 [Rhodosporidiobolus odoratus]
MSQSTKAGRGGSPRRPSALITGYLTSYNLASAAAWGYVLYRAVGHIAGQDGVTGIKEALGSQGLMETIDKRARTGFDSLGETVKWVQTAAILEAIHSGLRLVRSPFGTTVAQIASRLALVWGVCELFPEVPHSPFYISMVTAWSFAEIIRYVHYATGLMGLKLKALEWLRYTAFYILYPVGAGSEAVLIAFSAPYAKERFGTLAMFGVYALVSLWPPSLLFLMTYMHSQRRKHLSGGRSSENAKRVTEPIAPSTPSSAASLGEDKAISATSAASSAVEASYSAAAAAAAARAPRAVTARIEDENVIDGTRDDTPARSTRSRARASLAPAK